MVTPRYSPDVPDPRDVSATLNQSALLRARLEVIYDVVHETAPEVARDL